MAQEAFPLRTVAEPCPMAWDRMTGTSTRRFCDACRKHVHDLNAIGSEGARTLLASGSPCVRAVCDARTGEVVDPDRVVATRASDGTEVLRVRVRQRRLGAVVAMILAVTTPAWAVGALTPETSAVATSRLWDRLEAFAVWIGLLPEPMVTYEEVDLATRMGVTIVLEPAVPEVLR
jgi:hypothetical protein